jgi:hypothetical protein
MFPAYAVNEQWAWKTKFVAKSVKLQVIAL